MKKWLIVVILILVALVIGLGIWQYFGAVKFIPTSVKNETPIKVADLKNESEQAIGTIIYPGVASDKVEILKNDLAQKVTFEVTDSLAGVINIYSQDLSNRYLNYSITKKEIRKTDALDKKATVLSCSSSNGKLVITAWASNKGLTTIEIQKDNSF